MKRLFILWILACLVAAVPAQQTRKRSAQQRTTTTKSRTAPQKKATTQKRTTQKKKTTAKQPTVNSLKNEQTQVRKEIKEQERRLRANEQDVKKRLQNLMVLTNEIADKRKTIDTIRHDITRLDVDIHTLQAQLQMLKHELEERKLRYQKSMRYMH